MNMVTSIPNEYLGSEEITMPKNTYTLQYNDHCKPFGGVQ